MRQIRQRIGRTSQVLLASGHVHMILVNILLQLLGFGSVLFVAKFLRPDELAMIKTAQAYAAVLVVVAGAGLTAPVLLYCADPAYNDQAKQAMLKTAVRRVWIAGMAVILFALLMVRLGLHADPQTSIVYSVYALTMPGIAMTTLLFAYLQARLQFTALANRQAQIKIASIAAVIVSTYMWKVTGFLVSTVLSVYIGLIPLLKQAFPNGSVAASRSLPRDFSSRAMYGMVGTFITMMGQSSDFILMDFIDVDRVDVGRYALASVFLLGAMTMTGSIQTVVTPKFTALREQPAEFLAFLRQWSQRMPIISVVVAVLAIAAGYVLEYGFFGPKYQGFTLFLAILMVKYIIWSNYAVIGAAMLGAGIIKPGVWVAVITTVLSFAIGLPLINLAGAIGAAWAQVAVSIVAWLLILMMQRVEFTRMFGSAFSAKQWMR